MRASGIALRWLLAAQLSLAHVCRVDNGQQQQQQQQQQQHESLESPPDDYTRLGRAADDEVVNLRIYLSHSHRNYLAVAQEVSDPASAQYGQHLNARQLAQVRPDTSEASAAVQQWLRDQRVPDRDMGTAADQVTVKLTVGEANRLLRTTFDRYRVGAGPDVLLRTTGYAIPDAMKKNVDFIYPTVHFFRRPSGRGARQQLGKRQRAPTGPQNCTNNVCPPQLRAQYNIDYRPADNASGSAIAIAGFLNNFPNVTDVVAFLHQYGGVGASDPLPPIGIVSVGNGTLQPPSDGGSLTVEAELDLDYSMAFTGPLPVTFYTVGGRAPKVGEHKAPSEPISPFDDEPFVEFFEYLLALETPPQVVSVSYSDDERYVPLAYARRVCDLLAQAAARGVSVVAASGDGGASGTGGNTQCLGPGGRRSFIPTFPSGCPWITSVGATAGWGGVASYSSGGMSNVFPRPAWQDTQVRHYLAELAGKHEGMYNASGRAYPDLSLLGDNYLTLTRGYPLPHDGTSASTPVFAAMVALVNDVRLRRKKPPVGFLNPLLYAARSKDVYRDVADGSETNGCADRDFIAPGWEALAGWDAATGLGEPDFKKLMAALA
ncbi:uncharacterized protein UV8b_07616 [Ustilaginoidea virens]|uniref:tripeptidyl-peptidase II n=1 Tax=Ustilaginoidea virens TaxID=1159556 RepID=A0A063BVA5_USTVR|nr:uncharacterized protein UV8b_07616 [Ustilaginoidea virens]QUC23375.1 hypothetical protein UV8b_07616 [Ustilaginoidea virens]GAO19786.1 hypothetical protein UVI_02045770 [Ustilaginoidea virens]